MQIKRPHNPHFNEKSLVNLKSHLKINQPGGRNDKRNNENFF